MAEKLSNQIKGMIGVYLTAWKLSERGFITALTTRNAKGIDILATSPRFKTYSIQVKTITKKQNYWPIGRKPENSKSHYYIFVRAIRKDVPEFYIVKSSKVIKNAESNKSWGHGQIYYIKRNAIAKDRENWKQLEG